MLDTFVLVKNNETISPQLVTIREYGRWFEETFDNYTSTQELYLKSKNKSGETVLESHPGTRIGNYFDKHSFTKPTLYSWFILQDSTMMKRLKHYKMAELRDAIPISVNDEESRRMIRVYTVEQIETYIKGNIDRNFSIAKHIGIAKKVCIKESDMDKLIKPDTKVKKKKLF